jgi:hypothetical protein
MTTAKGMLLFLSMVAWGPPALAGPLAIVSVERSALTLESYRNQQLLTVRFRNDSDSPDPLPWVLLPVPVGFQLVPGSVRGPGTTAMLSLDGGESFLPESDVDFGDLEYATHVRWDLAGPIESGVSGIVSLRLRPQTSAND